MIQRIQTVYLFAVAVLCLAALLSPVGKYLTPTGDVVASFSNFAFSTGTQLHAAGPWALGVLLIVVILLSVLSILLFRKRMRQLRLTIFSTILLFGYLAVYAFYSWLYSAKLEMVMASDAFDFRIGMAAIYPVLCILLNFLAIHGIRKDEALVRSLDRLR